MSKYVYKTEPFPFQRDILNQTALKPDWAWFLQQGCGKTKLAIDNFSFLYLEKKINAVFWVAPNLVHRNFIEEEIPIHLPDNVPYETLTWKSGSMGTKKALARMDEILSTDKLAIVSINIEAVLSKDSDRFLKHFFKRKTLFGAIDESSVIATPNAKVSRKLISAVPHLKYRRIMNGTPARDGNPLDYYGQMSFLDKRILGFNRYSSVFDRYTGEIKVLGYKDFVAEWTEIKLPNQINPVRIQVRDFKGMPVYKNLEEIAKRVAARSSRVLKKDVFPDLPDKLYAKRLFSLSSTQRKHYNEVLEEYITEFSNGGMVLAERAAVRTMRLQQIACGYVGVEGVDDPMQIIPGDTPRLNALSELLQDNGGRPTIIWARFRMDHDLIHKRLAEMGIPAVRYDGTVGDTEKWENINAYRDGKVPVITANQKSMSRGHTLVNTEYMIYYSNYPDLEPRSQSEDRPHRPGLKHNVLITDLVADGTVDVKWINTLRNKQNVSDVLTGDPRKDWI